jgi:molybdopterin molybdotransferase
MTDDRGHEARGSGDGPRLADGGFKDRRPLTDGGFKDRTRLADARERLHGAVEPLGRSEQVPLSAADGRVLAAPAAARRDVPHYERAAMDGFAVRAEDTFVASDRSPAVLEISEASVGETQAIQVSTGDQLPDGADAVVTLEAVDRRGGAIEVFAPVAAGDNVAPVGEDVTADQHLFDAGHRLRPSDLGLLKAVGITAVAVAERPAVAVVPTGDELVEADPQPGEVVETNGLMVSRLVERWGATATLSESVGDYRAALRSAVEANLDADVVVTTGGSSVGERDVVAEVVDGLGEVLVHGVAIQPGHPVGFGVVEGTPVVMLPGYPVSTIVGAVQLLRPLIAWQVGATPSAPPSEPVPLARKIPSEPGVRTFTRVEIEESMGGERRAEPTTTGGAGVLSSVALSDGWVVVPESREGIPSGETVAVQDWEWSP